MHETLALVMVYCILHSTIGIAEKLHSLVLSLSVLYYIKYKLIEHLCGSQSTNDTERLHNFLSMKSKISMDILLQTVFGQNWLCRQVSTDLIYQNHLEWQLFLISLRIRDLKMTSRVFEAGIWGNKDDVRMPYTRIYSFFFLLQHRL